MEEMLPPPTPEEQESRQHTENVTRRTFMMQVGIALNVAIAAAIATPVVAYLLSPVLREKEYRHWIEIGNVSDFETGETTLIEYQNPFSEKWDGDTAKVPAWVSLSKTNQFTVFAINCAHLGCPVRWFAESQLFMCPCHGGIYYANGDRAAGPPERGLFKYDQRIDAGKLYIDAGQTPTLSNKASLSPCPKGPENAPGPALVTRINPCPGTNKPTIG